MGRKNKQNNRALQKAEEPHSVYGVIVQAFGHNRFKVHCSDELTRTASIRGNMIKRVWMQEKDFVLISLRDGDPKLCDIELKYTDEELKTLKEGGYIPETLLNAELGDHTITDKVDFSNL